MANRCLALVVAFAPVLTAAAQQVPPGPELDRLHELSARAHLERAARAQGSCDWREVAEASEMALRLTPEGSDLWYQACAVRTRALRHFWSPEEIEALARQVLDELAERGRSRPDAGSSALGLLHPITAGSVIEVEVHLAEVVQSRGQHLEAAQHLQAVLSAIGGRPTHASALGPRARLDLGHSLLRLGRREEAERVLGELVDLDSSTAEASFGLALLESGPAGLAAYRGKYAGDAAHRARMEAVRAGVPRARTLLAKALEIPVTELPAVVVGVADAPQTGATLAALTDSNPRVSDLPPVVVLFSEGLALDMADIETRLVHELAHAVLAARGGLAYEHLPAWMSEGLSMTLTAGELERTADGVLLLSSEQYPAPFLGDRPTPPLALELEPGGCDRFQSPVVALGILVFDEKAGPGAALAFARGLARGADPDAIVKELVGLDLAAEAGSAATRFLDTRREAWKPFIARLEDGRASGPEGAARAADAVLLEAVPAAIHARALHLRAQALEQLGRAGEAADAYAALLSMRHEVPALAETAILGRARSWIAAGRRSETSALLMELERDALSEWAREEARHLLGHARPRPSDPDGES